ncbi:MAG: hypothetical protein ABI542_02600 [Gemmatimonadota bacterium]
MSLAPALGRLGAPAKNAGDERVRLALVDRLVSAASPTGAAWVAAWHEASVTLADRVLDTASDGLRSAALHSRMPKTTLLALMPTAATRARLIEQLTAEGIDLERLEGMAAGAGNDRLRGAALEVAWDRAQTVARREQERWQRVGSAVRHWRRPWRPLVIVAATVIPMATLLSAWLGGWLPAPAWFEPIGKAFWSLPWP